MSYAAIVEGKECQVRGWTEEGHWLLANGRGRTLHNWEQGWRKPTGAARVLLKLAALNPRAVLQAAA